jgi:hypothetical protein
MTLDGTSSGNSLSHFKTTLCGIRENTFKNVCRESFGIAVILMMDPNVKTIKPVSASSANVFSGCKCIKHNFFYLNKFFAFCLPAVALELAVREQLQWVSQ